MLARVSSRCVSAACVRAPRPFFGVVASKRYQATSAQQQQRGAKVPKPSPDSRDILDRVACDHRQVEDLFRALRNRESNRAALVQELATTLIAHNDAEELHFYPHVRALTARDIKGDKEVTKEKAEHVQGLILLLNLMEEQDTQSQSWETKLTALAGGINHHVDDEEQMVHNLARTKIAPEKRAEMGDAFVRARDELMAQNIGEINSVRKLVKERASMLQKLKVNLLG